ncbi:MAG TPA: cation:proton antiporter [Gammaproteobacteria bacterium]|nr:cation:proton antiporter [Gammaproteobacteria bacterium]
MNSSVHQTEDLLFTILVQLIVMILAARLMHTLARRLGQPGVVGEIVAGLMLGPSLLGHLFPQASLALFGEHVPPAIPIISQIGLIFLMFQIGLDAEFHLLSQPRNRRGVLIVAAASIGVPLLLGFLVGQWSAPALVPDADPLPFSLFCGVALAITAMPVLGRIMREFALGETAVGVVAISAAAINDVVGWLLLAGVAAYAAAQFSGLHVLWQLGALLAFVLVMYFVVRPLAAWLVRRSPPRQGLLPSNLMAMVTALIFLAGICTYKIGIFAIFGGFALGVVFQPHAAFVDAWRKQVGTFVMVFFLPVFFTFTGLRTDITALSSGAALSWLAVILAAGIGGKILPVYLAGRTAGFDNIQSWILGSLMNTRGLMELIALNIGYDLGIIPRDAFTMLVIMAVVTNLMTGPLLRFLLPRMGHAVPRGIEA